MQSSFERMLEALRGFSVFSPAFIVENLLSGSIEADLGVKESIATCFFSDICSFTTISEKESPQGLAAFMSIIVVTLIFVPTVLIKALAEYFNEMSDIIMKNEGIVGDFIGDAVFAFWNCPTVTAHHALLACVSAWEQQERLVELRKKWIKEGEKKRQLIE